MNFCEIEEILDTENKSSASLEKKEKYIELMVEVLNEQSFSVTSINYLKKGFGFSGAKPIVKYLSGLDKHTAEEKITDLFKSDLIRSKNRNRDFQLCASLMGFALEEFDIDNKILRECIMLMPSISKTKRGKANQGMLLVDAPKNIQKYLMGAVAEDTKLPALDALGLKEIFVNEFKSMMVSILGKIQDGPIAKIEKFMLWVDPTRQIELPENTEKVSEDPQPVVAMTNDKQLNSEEKHGENVKHTEEELPTIGKLQEKNDDKHTCSTLVIDSAKTEKSVEKGTHNGPTDLNPTVSEADTPAKAEKKTTVQQKVIEKQLPSIKTTTVSSTEMVQGATLMFNLAERMMAWATSIEEMAGGNRKLTQDNDDLAKEIKHLRAELELEKRKCFDAKAEIVEDTRTIADLKAQLSDARRDNAELKAQSITTQDELARLNAILSVYSADKENAQKEQLNSIAAKLKAEYRDFKDAENDDMTIDLGENFRFQLAQIFKILVKAGIDVEKR